MYKCAHRQLTCPESIRTPCVEQILRGVKTIEYRSRRTNLIGERFYIYASRTPGPAEEFAMLAPHCKPGDLPTGLIVGTAKISKCVRGNGHPRKYEWHVCGVRRFKRPWKPKGTPQPVWWRPS